MSVVFLFSFFFREGKSVQIHQPRIIVHPSNKKLITEEGVDNQTDDSEQVSLLGCLESSSCVVIGAAHNNDPRNHDSRHLVGHYGRL